MQSGKTARVYESANWALSRSKIDLYLNCKRCFYLENKLGVKRPPGFPFNLNSAVDALLKKEFDAYRSVGKPHPLMLEYGIEAVPFKHEELETWRSNFKGIRIEHKKTGFTVYGAVDDIWIDKEGKLIVVDYKSTSKNERIDKLDQQWHTSYKRQMEIYIWLLRQKGFKVSDTGYFVYANADKNKESFDACLEFEMTVIPYRGDGSWVENAICEIKELLDENKIPQQSDDCDYCNYVKQIQCQQKV